MSKTIQEKIDKLTQLLSATKLQEEKNVEDAIRGYKAIISDESKFDFQVDNIKFLQQQMKL